MLMSYNEENIYDFEQEHDHELNTRCLKVTNTLKR